MRTGHKAIAGVEVTARVIIIVKNFSQCDAAVLRQIELLVTGQCGGSEEEGDYLFHVVVFNTSSIR